MDTIGNRATSTAVAASIWLDMIASHERGCIEFTLIQDMFCFRSFPPLFSLPNKLKIWFASETFAKIELNTKSKCWRRVLSILATILPIFQPLFQSLILELVKIKQNVDFLSIDFFIFILWISFSIIHWFKNNHVCACIRIIFVISVVGSLLSLRAKLVLRIIRSLLRHLLIWAAENTYNRKHRQNKTHT